MKIEMEFSEPKKFEASFKKGGKSSAEFSETFPARGEKGEPFRYEDFTEEQLKALKGKDGKDGKDGTNGTDGVGIQSVVQTTTSTADSGENVITVTLTNGATSTFKVKNGSKGSSGSTPEIAYSAFTLVSPDNSWEEIMQVVTGGSVPLLYIEDGDEAGQYMFLGTPQTADSIDEEPIMFGGLLNGEFVIGLFNSNGGWGGFVPFEGGGDGGVTPADYITSKGTSGNWTYEKYKSGAIKLMGRIPATFGATWTSIGGHYRTTTNIELPFNIPYADRLEMNGMAADSGALFFVNGSNQSVGVNKIELMAYKEASGNATYNVTIPITIYGKSFS